MRGEWAAYYGPINIEINKPVPKPVSPLLSQIKKIPKINNVDN